MADETLKNNALATSAEIKRFVPIKGSTASVDNEIIASINRISKAIETYCDREFYIQERTETYEGTGGEQLWTDQYPITNVSGVWLSATRTWNDNSLIDSDDYYEARDGYSIVYPNNVFTEESYENIRIIYTAGLHSGVEDTSADAVIVPDDLKLACIKEVVRNYKFHKDKGLNSRATGGGEIVGDTLNFITDEFMPETIAILKRYYRIMVY